MAKKPEKSALSIENYGPKGLGFDSLWVHHNGFMPFFVLYMNMNLVKITLKNK